MPYTQKTVYVARGDLMEGQGGRQNSRNLPDPSQVDPFPTTTQDQGRARTLLRKLFETKEATEAIILFAERTDAEHRARDWADKRVMEINLVGHLYRELRLYVQEVQYTGALPRIQGNAFLVFRHLAHRPETREEREARRTRAAADAAKKHADAHRRKGQGVR